MMHYDILKIRKKIRSSLDPVRYEHTLGVSYMCIALAMKYGCDLERAEIAGLLHDCAKRYDEETILSKSTKYNISVTDSELAAPAILHAKLGAFMAMHKYHVEDKEIISAILVHTTGKPSMSLLEQILFVADYIEPRRNKAPNLAEIRKIAFEDLNKATHLIMKDTLNYLKCQKIPFDQITENAYHYYCEINCEKEN